MGSLSQKECTITPQVIGYRLLFVFVVQALVLMLPVALGRSAPIHDVSVDEDGGVMVETSWPHRLLQCQGAPIRLQLCNTKHPYLDSQTRGFQAKIVSPVRIELLCFKGLRIQEESVDASMGALR